MNKLIRTVIAAFFIQISGWMIFPVVANTAETSAMVFVMQAELQNGVTIDTNNAAAAPQTVSPEDMNKQTVENNSQSSLVPASTDAVSETVIGKNVHFYQKWWFTLLILLLFVPFVWKFFEKREKKIDSDIQAYRKQNDELKLALEKKEDEYKGHEKDVELKLREEEKLKFQAAGLAKFSEIITNNRNDIKKLGQNIIFELVEYVGANSGSIYMTNEDEKGDTLLELLSAYAPSAEQIKTKIYPGEGYVGACYKEGVEIEVDDIPETYSKISSGLGEARPRSLTFIPLIQDEEKLGIIEIASFNKIEPYKLEFVKNLSRDIASSIAIKRANEKMQEMLEKSRSQAEELLAQEEEMRQNMEEMQATQEELKRQAEANKKMQEDLIKEKALLDALMDTLPDYIYFKDKDSKFIRISQSMLKLFPVDNLEDMIGKSDFDFHKKEAAQEYYDEEQEIIKKRKGFVDKIDHEVTENGVDQWVTVTKMPLLDKTGNCIGTFGMTKDITSIKQMEMDAKEKNEQLASQEEELRQNLEEMQATQDELNRQMKENEKMHKAVEDNQKLLISVLDHIPGKIFVKDHNHALLLLNSEVARVYNTTVDKLIGTTDFDNHPHEDAREYQAQEREIIEKGEKTFIQEETLTGETRYLRTTKMPFYIPHLDKTGLLGIQTDITDQYKMEQEIKQQNEELQSQEEELRQNLEEMQATQDELNRQMKENEKMHKAIEDNQKLLISVLDHIPGKIFVKDHNHALLLLNSEVARVYNTTVDKLIGTTDFDNHPHEDAKEYQAQEREIIENGAKTYIQEETLTGEKRYLKTTKMPFYIPHLDKTGLLGIQTDITDQYTMEQEIKQQNEELQAQEEELRQNLEEMQTIQEDLQRNIKENEKMQQDLIKEKALLDALMNTLPDYIYFKDRDSKFIRISQSMLKLFPVDNLEDMIGKSDFDFHQKEAAQQFYDEEQKIIKSQKGFIDKIDHEVTENGVDQWVTVTKMPLLDRNGKCIGTFGMTKDITPIKMMEMEAKEKSEQLASQEEELRQNLEEMQTIQEDLQRSIAENEKMHKAIEDNRKLLISVLDHIPGKIFVKDHKHALLLLNSEVARVYNTTVDKLIGTTDFDNHPREQAKEYQAQEREIIEKGAKTYIQEETLTGEKRYLKTTKMPFYIPHLGKTGLLGIQTDVTDQYLLEQEIKQQNEELQSQGEELRQNLEEMQTIQEDMQKQIKEKDRIKKEFERKEKELMKEIQKLKAVK